MTCSKKLHWIVLIKKIFAILHHCSYEVHYAALTLFLSVFVFINRFGEKGTTCTLATFPRNSTSSPQSVIESSSTGSSPVTSDSESSESDSESNPQQSFRPLNFVPNESRLYQTYRKSGRHQQYRSQVSYLSRDKYRWINNTNSLIMQA